eukprot:14258126-Alexandrium_andersonii.AAC.1
MTIIEQFTWMGAYGAPTPKGTYIYGNCEGAVRQMRRSIKRASFVAPGADGATACQCLGFIIIILPAPVYIPPGLWVGDQREGTGVVSQ